MASEGLYDEINGQGLGAIRGGGAEVDPALAGDGALEDGRRGVSLVMPVRGSGIEEAYAGVVEAFSRVEPGQYYYPFSDLHVTIFDFLSVRAGYQRDGGLETAFAEVAADALEGFSLELEFRGLAFSPAAGLIRGFDGDGLVGLREGIRKGMRERGLALDERYESRSAHACFCRFREGPRRPLELCRLVEASRDTVIGQLRVGRVELVEHDWFNRAGTKRIVRFFSP